MLLFNALIHLKGAYLYSHFYVHGILSQDESENNIAHVHLHISQLKSLIDTLNVIKAPITNNQ